MFGTILQVLAHLAAAAGQATADVIGAIAKTLGLSVDFVISLLKSLGIL